MRPFVVCVHDASPAWARETEAILRDLEPLVGRRLVCGVVPDWHGAWPLTSHPEYCALVRNGSDELLLHGYRHQRTRGRGPITVLAGSDEMNGLDVEETRRTLERGQRVFAEAFGAPARGFLAPAWQRGRVRLENGGGAGLEHVMGFFSAESRTGRKVRLATWSWDCGRWRRLGHVGHAVGALRHALFRGVPVVAIHPRDVERGYRHAILRLTRGLLDAGHQPTTARALLEARPC